MMNSEMSSASYQTAAGTAHQSANHAQVHPQHARPQHHQTHNGGAVHHQQATQNQQVMYQQQQQQMHGQQMPQQQMFTQPQLGNGSGMPMGGGGTLYTNLIPGHYRYGAKPPAPPPGPLSYSNTSSSSQSRARPQQLLSTSNVRNGLPLEQSYQNIPAARTSPTKSHSERNYLQVSEPDDDDEFFDVVSLDLEDDEKYYRPFKHAGNGGESPNRAKKKGSQKGGNSKARNAHTTIEETKPVDLLSVLLGSSALQQLNTDCGVMSDMAILMGGASAQSQKARAMTDALAAKQHKGEKAEEGGNDLYAATSNAHAEAAISFQKVYRMLLGLESKGDNRNGSIVRQKAAGDALSPSEELAKSMLVLANAHARTAKSLGSMGEKWNMGKVDAGGRMVSKNAGAATEANAGASGKSKGNDTGKNASKAKANGSTPNKDGSADTAASRPEALQHERLRMAVRGALDTANHEEDITNSTFLARSTLNASKNSKQYGSKAKSTKNKLAGMMGSKRKNTEQGVNPVDDLMRLERELQSMDMALEMENSVASLGAATTATRPDGSFMVVPKGSSYLSSSSMWSHQQHTKPPQQGMHQQKGAAGVRSRANHLQNFASKASAPSPPRQKQGLQITPGNPGALDQSWWGGGQGSILANAAATATSSNQRHPPNSADPNNPNATSSTGTKQLMQLMDSLKRLGDENAQLMREVEDAKAARAEAKTAQDMVANFKSEYAQRFNKVKEALGKYSSPNADNPVAKSAYMKSVSATEIKKRDEMIKQLSSDLKKERDEVKRKDGALNKYEAFYREVKARSAEKAKQRAEQERKKAEEKQKLDQQRLEQQRRLQQQKQQQRPAIPHLL